MEEFERKLEESMAACLEAELKTNLSEEVHNCMQSDLESELMESMRNDLLEICTDFADDEAMLES